MLDFPPEPGRGFQPPPPAFRLSHYWMLLAGLGSANLIAGLVSIILPGVTVLMLSLLLGLLLSVTGAGAAAFGFRLRHLGLPGLWAVALGGLTLLAGVLILSEPGRGVRPIVVACGLWFVLTGLASLLVVRAGHRESSVLSAVLGALSVVAGVVALADTSAGADLMSIVLGFGFLLRGVVECTLALRLRCLHRLGV